jgi:aminobenzoyl-glutamate transport protein
MTQPRDALDERTPTAVASTAVAQPTPTTEAGEAHKEIFESRGFMEKFLDGVEKVGNMVPHPVVIFLILIGIVIVLSQLLALLGTSVTVETIDPETDALVQETAAVKGLLTAEGIRFIYTSPIVNFLNFNAIGVILVAMVGVGVADEAGLIVALIRKVVAVSPGWALAYILAALGIASSIASDAGYVVLIPLGAVAYLAAGRHPIAGLTLTFAAVAAAFGVNFIIAPLDGVLTEITNDAIHLSNPTLTLTPAANLYFSIASAVMLTMLLAIMSKRFMEPRLGVYQGEMPAVEEEGASAAEAKGLRWALYAFLGFLVVLLLLTVLPGAPLQNPETGSIRGSSPFMNSIIITIMLLFLATGSAFGAATGKYKDIGDVIKAIEKTFAGLGGLVFLFMVIAQFIAYFNYTNMATIAAVNMADALEAVNIGAIPLLLGFVLVIAIIDIILGGAIPKWAIFAPIFVPLFMRLGIPPEAVLAAYRVGDSPLNAITPLMAYFALILTFVQRYQKGAGVGTMVAMMIPYTVVVLAVWTVFLVVWVALGIPFGPR